MLIKQVLEEVAPYCIVCGSYARGTQTKYSDIDLYIGYVRLLCDKLFLIKAIY